MNTSPMIDKDFNKTVSSPEIRDEGNSASGSPQDQSLDAVSKNHPKTSVAVIDGNTLFRDCLAHCLAVGDTDLMLASYRDVEHWHGIAPNVPVGIVLLCATGLEPTRVAIRRNVAFVIRAAFAAQVIVVSDREEALEIVEALEQGAKGYISMSANLDVAIAAIRLVRAGGIFVPAGSLTAFRSAAASVSDPRARDDQDQNLFTDRQLDVIRLLRQGEANKRIAYSLNVGECTVKVHVRNIMQKIKARNRTEIAFLTKGLFPQSELN
ncbi:LuxR C-terminal-related transcriptional regulator [Labrys sp. La1]|uniref:LuxR C-terminal-related transcriptional regulator n=1 Tax=Labrys sp. La1 TaxID=3404917 RepID=UPI003EBEE430